MTSFGCCRRTQTPNASNMTAAVAEDEHDDVVDDGKKQFSFMIEAEIAFYMRLTVY